MYGSMEQNVIDQQRQADALDDMQSVDGGAGSAGRPKILVDDPQFLIEQGVMKQDTEEFLRFKR